VAKKAGLGRGLSNLIPGAEKSESGGIQISSNPEYQEISIQEIEPNPNQPRKRFQEAELQELAKTIESVGIIEPVVLRKVGEKYQLISGERRWRACKLAGYKKVPAVVKQVDDVQALEMGIIENIQREELNPVEEARAYEYWMSQTGLKPSDLADRVGKDRSTITNLIRLLKLPDAVLQKIEEKKLTAGAARPLLGIADKKMLTQLAEKVIHEGWTARQVEEEVARITEPDLRGGSDKSGKRSGAESQDANIRNLEDKLRTRLMTRVQIQHKKDGSGKLILGYANLDDLDRILELLDKK
jgi:ParB family chromosome partitioning protein